MDLGFIVADGVLCATQGLLVAAPGAGLPRWAAPLAGRWWTLVLPLSIVVVIGLIALVPDSADGFTWLALIAVPPLAGVALGWALRRAWPPAALLAPALLVVSIAELHTLAGDAAALALSALACATLGRLLAGAAPGAWLKAGIVVMATVDAILVFSRGLDQPNAVLNAAVPAQGLPRLQLALLGPGNMGFGDLFIAAVFGGVLAAEGRPVRTVAIATALAAMAFDLLFLVTDELPATVPIAVVLIGSEAVRYWRSGPRSVRPA